MLRHNRVILLTLCIFFIPLVTAECTDVGLFNQSDVKVTLTPSQPIDEQKILIDITDNTRPDAVIEMDHEKEEETHIYTPISTHLPKGEYVFNATLDYSDYTSPTRCIQFEVDTNVSTPWITGPSPQDIFRPKVGLIKNKTTPFELQTERNKELTCKYVTSGSFNKDSYPLIQMNDKYDPLVLDHTGALNWSQVLLDRNYEQGEPLPLHFYCEENLSGVIRYSYDILFFTYLESRPEIVDLKEYPSVIREAGINPYLEVDTNTKTYCYLEDTPRPESGLKDSDFKLRSFVSTAQTTTNNMDTNIEGDVVCEDLSGRKVNKSYNIAVDMSPRVIWEPPKQVPTSQFDVTVRAAQYRNCTVSYQDQKKFLKPNTDIRQDGYKVFNGTSPVLQPGDNELEVSCSNEFNVNLDTESVQKTVTYDSTPPEISVNTTQEQCNWPQMEFTTQELRDEYTDPERLTVQLTTTKDPEILYERTFTDLTIEPKTFEVETENIPYNQTLVAVYTLFDSVGRNTTVNDQKFSLKRSSNVQCDDVSPTIDIDSEYRPENTTNIYGHVSCQDNRDCRETYYYTVSNDRSKHAALTCLKLDDSTPKKNLDNPVVMDLEDPYTLLCAVVGDMNGNSAFDMREYRGDVPPFCSNNKKDIQYGETGVDCGGPCARCGHGDSCDINRDCISGLLCTDDECSVLPPFCRNGKFDTEAGETAEDCGGPCGDCSAGNACLDDSDCASGICSTEKTCVAATCSDGLRNQEEVYTDCGGPNCAEDCPVQPGDVCNDERDCPGPEFMCIEIPGQEDDECQMSPMQCRNGEKDSRETDIDCGGICGACQNEKSCSTNSDCIFENCIEGTCKAPSCTDGRKNNNEPTVDCGHMCSRACVEGDTCRVDSDCATGNCMASSKKCGPSSCTNSKIDGSETDLDCGGGDCDTCRRGQQCNADTDCTTNYCSSEGVCATDPDLDTDGDGMPDVWENQHSSSATGVVADEDLDNDGFTNLEEFQAGTDPTNPNDHPERPETNIIQYSLIGGGISLLIVGGVLIYVETTIQEPVKSSKPAHTPLSTQKNPKKQPETKRRKSIMDSLRKQKDSIMASFSTNSSSGVQNMDSNPKHIDSQPLKNSHTSHTKEQVENSSSNVSTEDTKDYVDIQKVKDKDTYKDLNTLHKQEDTGDDEEDIFGELEELSDE